MTAAAMARPASKPLTRRTGADATTRDGEPPAPPGGRGAGMPVEVGGRLTDIAGAVAPLVGGRGADGAEGAATPTAGDAAGGGPAEEAGIRIVGAAEGFGGKLMRTVSFLGWTFAASAGFGGTGAPDGFGVSSAIYVLCRN
jgi:hypothetical protein